MEKASHLVITTYLKSSYLLQTFFGSPVQILYCQILDKIARELCPVRPRNLRINAIENVPNLCLTYLEIVKFVKSMVIS
jgi:hypothetical protein